MYQQATGEALGLEHVTVASCAMSFPGQFCTGLLARLGARVINFEPPGGSDNRSHQAFNGGKESVLVDLKNPADVQLVRDVVARADVFIESWRPGVAARLGLGVDVLMGDNADLVYCSLSGYGAAGKLRDRPGHDVNQVVAAGLPYAGTGAAAAGDRPFDIPVADLAGAMSAALRIAAAVAGVRAGGKGRFVDVSLAGAVQDWNDAFGGAAGMASFSQLLAGTPSYGTFLSADGHVLSIGIVGEDKFWRELCRALGLEEYQGLSYAERTGSSGPLRAALADRVGSLTRAELEAKLAAVDTCWAFPVTEPADISGGIPPLTAPVHPLDAHGDTVRREVGRSPRGAAD